MRALIPLLLLASTCFGQSSVQHYLPTAPWSPTWTTCTVTKTAGNWVPACSNSVTASSPQAAVAAITQTVNLFALPANWDIIKIDTVKSTVACVGITVITIASVGVTGTAGYLVTGLTYDLKAAVSATNVLNPVLAVTGPSTASSTTLTVTIAGGAENISAITDGCAFQVPVLWSQRS